MLILHIRHCIDAFLLLFSNASVMCDFIISEMDVYLLRNIISLCGDIICHLLLMVRRNLYRVDPGGC